MRSVVPSVSAIVASSRYGPKRSIICLRCARRQARSSSSRSGGSTGTGSGPEQRQHRIGQRRTAGEVLADAPGDVLELLDEHRTEIDHRARVRVALQMRRHVGVVLDGVQVGPRQRVLAGERVAVMRLVHVPQQDHRQARRGAAHASAGRGSAQHVRRHQHHAVVGDVKAPRVVRAIAADARAVGNVTALVDDRAVDHAAAADFRRSAGSPSAGWCCAPRRARWRTAATRAPPRRR